MRIQPAPFLSSTGWTNEVFDMEGRKWESGVDALGSYEDKDPSYSSRDARKRAQPLRLSVCPAASLLGYLYSPWEQLIHESPFSRSERI